MNSPTGPSGPAASQQAVVEAALVLLERMGLSPADLSALLDRHFIRLNVANVASSGEG